VSVFHILRDFDENCIIALSNSDNDQVINLKYELRERIAKDLAEEGVKSLGKMMIGRSEKNQK
jgi:hypothetical protein